jgi:streptomycin 6-kinase
LSYSFVAFVATETGEEAVLKIGVPNSELTTEIAALRIPRGRPVVQLLDADRQLGALLLRRLVPGTPLADIEDDEDATVAAAHLIQAIPESVPGHHRFPSVGDWALAFDRLRSRFDGQTGPVPGHLVQKALQLFAALQRSSPQGKLLHGDLHHDNILRHGQGSWAAIDPKGMIGDPAYEAARSLHNPISGFLSMDHPRSVARRRVDILASALGEDRSRLLAWAFFDATLSACWSVEAGEDWQYFLVYCC